MEASNDVVVSKPDLGKDEPKKPSWEPKSGFGKFLDKWFKISKRGSTPAQEIIGGLVTFLAMFYILPVNSNMLGAFVGTTNGVAGVFLATAISAGLTTLMMGIYANFPVGLASGMGVNALIAYTVCSGLGYSYAEAMALVLVDGLLFFIISVTPLRKMIVNAIPKSLKMAISAGIGFFICFIGLQNAGIIVADSSVCVAFGNLLSLPVLMAIVGILLVLVLSSLPKTNKVLFWISKFAVIIAMVIMGVVCGILGECKVDGFHGFLQDGLYSSYSGFSDVFGACFKGFGVFTKPEAYALAFGLLFVDFFDTTGTLVGVESGAGMVDEKTGLITVNDQPAMITDAVGTCIGAVLGTSTVTSFVESTTGVSAGARTGLSASVTGIMFLLAIGIYPILGMFDNEAATSLALVFVGLCMFKNLKNLDWDDWISCGSGFIAIIIMVVSYSITDGIGWGFITYTVMSLAAKKWSKKDIPVYVIALFFLVLYIVQYTTYKA